MSWVNLRERIVTCTLQFEFYNHDAFNGAQHPARPDAHVISPTPAPSNSTIQE